MRTGKYQKTRVKLCLGFAKGFFLFVDLQFSVLQTRDCAIAPVKRFLQGQGGWAFFLSPAYFDAAAFTTEEHGTEFSQDARDS